MSIYTKTGDKGDTSLFGGTRVSKSDLQIEAYGSIDELTSVIGLLHAKVKEEGTQEFLLAIQKDLYKMMAVLSGAEQDLTSLNERTHDFEQKIDELQNKLPKLTRFILPGGTESSAIAHIARSTSRRAERAIVSFFTNSEHAEKLKSYQSPILQYMNRLSDLFFMIARDLADGKEILT